MAVFVWRCLFVVISRGFSHLIDPISSVNGFSVFYMDLMFSFLSKIPLKKIWLFEMVYVFLEIVIIVSSDQCFSLWLL